MGKGGTLFGFPVREPILAMVGLALAFFGAGGTLLFVLLAHGDHLVLEPSGDGGIRGWHERSRLFGTTRREFPPGEITAVEHREDQREVGDGDGGTTTITVSVLVLHTRKDMIRIDCENAEPVAREAAHFLAGGGGNPVRVQKPYPLLFLFIPLTFAGAGVVMTWYSLSGNRPRQVPGRAPDPAYPMDHSS